jgi:hypothetical protein
MNYKTWLQGVAVVAVCALPMAKALAQTPIEVLNQFATGDAQRSLAAAIGTLCPPGNRLSDRLQQDCNALVGAAFGGDVSVRNALGQIVADNVNSATDRALLGGIGMSQMPAGSSSRGRSMASFGIHSYGNLASLGTPGTLSFSAGENFGRWSVFGNFEYEDFDRDRTLNEDGFDGDRQTFLIGIDRRFSDRFNAGIAISFDRSDLKFSGASGSKKFDATRLLLFGNWTGESGVYLDALASRGWRDTDQVRRVAYDLGSGVSVNQQFAASFDSKTTSLAATLGYHWQREGFGLDPFLTLEFASIDADGYQETASAPTGNGAGWAIIAADSKSDLTTLDVGMRATWVVSRPNSVWVPQVELAYVNVLDQDENDTVVRFVGDQSASAGLGVFNFGLANDAADDDYFRLSLGMVAQWAQGRSGFINIATRLGERGYDSTTLTLGLRFEL